MNERQVMYGYSCWNYGECRSTVNAPTQEDADQLVHEAGWAIGLDGRGQAHYSCPYCKEALWNVKPLCPLTQSSPVQLV